MKRYIIISAFALASCAGGGNQKNDTSKTLKEDTLTGTIRPTAQQNKRYCFRRTEGTGNQDTTIVQFTVNVDRIEGTMNWIPKEKDSRKGILTGTISDHEIKAVWSYIQEGMKDSMVVAFKLTPQRLAQKPLKVNAATGRQETDEEADYTVIYEQDECGD